MNAADVQITRITKNSKSKGHPGFYTVCMIEENIEGIIINGAFMTEVSNAVFFFDPTVKWEIRKNNEAKSSGYILHFAARLLDHAAFQQLHINEVRIFNTSEIPKINLAPGIERRVKVILEMLDELINSDLNHKEQAILSLLNTFFIYCDGKCNVKSIAFEKNAKKTLVFKFKNLVNKKYHELHEVDDFARLLNVSPKYLNESVKNVLGNTAKGIILEQLIMKARHELKFTDNSVKEISNQLGFSSSEYFSQFFKNQTGMSPSGLRNS